MLSEFISMLRLHLYKRNCLFNLVFKVLPRNQIWDVIIVILLRTFTAFGLLHGLVALGELSEGSEGVGTKLVENARDELGEFLVLTVSVDSEGVRGDGGVNWVFPLAQNLQEKLLILGSRVDVVSGTSSYLWELRNG